MAYKIPVATGGLADPGSNGVVVRTALDTTTARSLTQPAAGITITNSDGVSGNPTFALADDLSAVEGLSGTGMAARTGASSWNTRTITGTTDQITVTNGNGASGNPTLSFPTTFYATGTWTPTMLGSGTAGTPTYGAQVGRYTRIGETVFVEGRVTWNAHTGTGNMVIGGLPFTVANVGNLVQYLALYPAVFTATAFTNPYCFIRLVGGGTTGTPSSFNNATGAVAAQALPGSGDITAIGTYRIA